MRYFSSLFRSKFIAFQKQANKNRHGNMPAEDLQRLRELEQENRELKRANAILQKTASFLAQVELKSPTKYRL